MAALIWGSYARFVANPMVAAVVIVSVLAINIGLILGSEMWNVPLATDISRLWIDPASEVASNNALVEKYGNKVDLSFNELFTLGNEDGSNMGNAAGMAKWFAYSQAVYDTVVIVNGTAFTMLDICNARLGQSPYTFGCSVSSPIDYFKEGGFFHPEDGTAQFLLDTKVAYPKVLPDGLETIDTKKFLWEWAINADAGSRGASAVYTTYFTNECMTTKKVLCGNNTVLATQVNNLLGGVGFPSKVKFQLAWTKAQLMLGVIQQVTSLTGAALFNGTCTDKVTPVPFFPHTMEDPSLTVTPRIVLKADAGLLALLQSKGYVDNSTYSLAPCAGRTALTPCPTSTCPLALSSSVALFDFASSCSKCIMTLMYWSGDLDLILPGIGPVVGDVVSADATSILNFAGYPGTVSPPIPFIPSFKIHVPGDAPASRATSTALVILGADGGKACGATNLTTLSNIAAENCTYLWDKFYTGTVAGLSNDIATAKQTATDRALLLAEFAGKAEVELPKVTTFSKAVIDLQWRLALRSTLISEVVPAVSRHSVRPAFTGANESYILQTLSGFKNDLLTQNLRGAIFGSARPAVSQIKAGKCQCATGFAGAQCHIKKDLICDCDSTLKPTCLSKLLDSCFDLAPCATYPVILGLIANSATLNIPAEKMAPLLTFDQETKFSASFIGNPSSAVPAYLGFCQAYAPCVDTVDITTYPYNASVSTDFTNFFADATYNLGFFVDSSSPVPYLMRATLLTKGCLANGGACISAVTPFDDALTLTTATLQPADLTAYGTCLTASVSLTNCLAPLPANALSTITVNWAAVTICPTVKAKMTDNSLGFTQSIVNLGSYFLCLAEQQNAANTGTAFRSSISTTLWPKASASLKTGACTAAVTADAAKAQACIPSIFGFLLNGLSKVVAAVPLVAVPSVKLSLGVANNAIQTYSQFRTGSGLFSAPLVKLYPSFTGNLTDTAYAGCTDYFDGLCATIRNNINTALSGVCTVANLDESLGGAEVKGLEKTDCTAGVFAALPGVLSSNLNTKATAVASVSKLLARYKFLATVFGACKATGGVAEGDGDCWEDNDCNAAKGQGTCSDLGDVVPLTFIGKFAAVLFSNSPEGVVSAQKAFSGKYRQLANAPILARYAAANGRRLLDLGTTGPIPDMTEELAAEILHAWRIQFLDNVNAFQEAQATTDPDAISADSAENLLDEISEADPKILILGYGLMLLYAFLACTNWSTDVPGMLNGSRALVAQSGIILIAISVASGLGVSHLFGIEWSAAATQIVPFVMLGLGVSDVFIMLRTFPLYHDGVAAADAAAKGLTISGPSMLLVTVTNAGVFACGVLTGMPVVVNFALQAVIVCIANYLTINTVLPALLILDYHRQAKGKMDLLPCVTVGTSARHQVTHEGEYEPNVFNRFCVPHYNKCLLSIPGKLFFLALGAAFLGSAIYGTEVVAELGLQLSDIAPVGSDLSSALITRDESFAFYTVSIVTSEANWAKREVQQGIVKVFDDVMATEKVVDGSGTPWMKAFMAWGLPVSPDYNPNAPGEICDPSNTKTGGKCGLKANCTVITADASVVAGGIPFYNETDFYRCLNEWINSDLVYEALKPGFDLDDASAPRGNRSLKLIDGANGEKLIPFSRGTVITSGLAYNSDFVQLIEEVRAVANSETVPPTFPIGEPIDFWDQYVSLREIINRAVGFGLLICFVSIFTLLLCLAEGDSGLAKRFLATFWAAALATGIIAMTVYEIYGYMAFAQIKISAIPAISIIMSTGVAVEYTAYICVQFVNAAGSRNERAHHALMLMMAPTIDGAVTMFLGVVMLAASPFLFIVKYFFYPWLFIIGFGFFNGVVILPIMFALIGPMAIKTNSKTAEGGATDLTIKKA